VQPPAGEPTSEAGRAQDALVLTPYEKVTATAQSGFWLGLLGLGVVGCYFVIKELMPKYVSWKHKYAILWVLIPWVSYLPAA
jgi:hypothetical protein